MICISINGRHFPEDFSREGVTPEHKNQAKKKRPVKVAFFRFKEFKGLEAMYGAADGTRTRDPRRDRPVF